MEHAGESGVQLSVDAEMEFNGDYVAEQVTYFAASLWRSSQTLNPGITNTVVQ